MPERFDVPVKDLRALNDHLSSGSFQSRPGCILEVSSSFLDRATDDDRTIFVNMVRIYNVNYKVVGQVGGVVWVCP